MKLIATYFKGDECCASGVEVRAVVKCQCGIDDSYMVHTGFYDDKIEPLDEKTAVIEGWFKGWVLGEVLDTCPKCVKKQEADHKPHAEPPATAGMPNLSIVMKAVTEHLKEQADAAKWKARAEALGRAMRGEDVLCESCVHCELGDKEEPCATCYDAGGWVFNEAKYSEGAE